MAESTLDSSAGLLSVKTVFDSCKTDDQVTSENNLLLVPQWLYAKPTETKTELLNIPKDMHTTNFGNSNDPVQKKDRLSDGFLDKKEWGKAAPGIENSRRWQEEERETGLLGRRDRRKEDRHADNVSGRESAESRGLTSSDRWNNVENRSSGVEMRQQSKWSSRWGPEDKERDSWTEKRMETNKEDSQSEKQIVGSSNCLSTEPKTDKWRPRHRLEVHSSGSPVYRAAPGSGTERRLPESSKAGFAAERGRGRPSSTGLIGAVSLYKSDHLLGKSGSCTDKIRYSRQELLDIYRKERHALSFDTTPEGTEEVLPITHSNSIVPWAFVAPNEEEVELGLETLKKLVYWILISCLCRFLLILGKCIYHLGRSICLFEVHKHMKDMGSGDWFKTVISLKKAKGGEAKQIKELLEHLILGFFLMFLQATIKLLERTR